ncbi:hypothetical protein BGZ83_007252 [Gryganskiella cystojenkinii]|nr:hypothetical protein BGZ83_007252 [Gryganskiella cystojenkinii]
MLGQQTPNNRRSVENLAAGGGSSSSTATTSSNNSNWTSPQASSFSRFQDIEVPLGGTTELNDDAKEKSLRRRSLLDERAARRRSLLMDGENRRRSHNNNGNNNTNQDQGAGSSGSSSSNLTSPNGKLRPSGASSLLGVVDSQQSAPLPSSLLKVSADSFEQWLKLATDNKINANNSWNFALIDYFHEMSLLREGDSINFQKASCTLDGCVKIYTSRVDSVATETTKLLGGLATSSKGREPGENAEQDEDDDEEETNKPVKKKHSSRSGNTLAKDFSQLSLDKFNLEFSVDPLFKKTSADFDEGGARGLLLNHLSVDAEGKIIFDAGDARDEGDEDEDEEEVSQEEHNVEDVEAAEEMRMRSSKKKKEVEPTTIDIQRLRYKFLPALNHIFDKDICPSLRDFQLSGTSDMDFSFLKRFHGDGEDEDGGQDDDDMDGGMNQANAFDDDDDFSGGGGDDYGLYDEVDNGGMEGIEGHGAGEDDAEHRDQAVPVVEVDAFADLDDEIAARRQGPDVDNILMETDVMMGKTPTNMYEYFDSALMRNWAGPEHWKLRKIPKEKPAPAVNADGEPVGEEEVAGPKSRKVKTALVIDFIDAEEVDEDELFAPAEVSALSMTAAQEAEMKKSKHVLPDDVHFSSKQLLKMFIKPSFIIKSKTKRPSGYLQQQQQPEEAESFNLTFPDEQFWASHTNNVDEGDVAALTDQLDQTQIYNDYVEDDDDEYGFQDQGFFGAGGAGTGVGGKPLGLGLGFGLEMGGDGNDYASQLVSEPKRVKATFISFSKTAKKVDVKRLKDNIWKEMNQQSLKRQPASREASKKKSRTDHDDEDGEEEAEEDNNKNSEDEEEQEYIKKEQKFTEIIGGLSKVYPEQKLRDISVPFCFICLLHLANEKNLSIEGTENLNELVIKQE